MFGVQSAQGGSERKESSKLEGDKSVTRAHGEFACACTPIKYSLSRYNPNGLHLPLGHKRLPPGEGCRERIPERRRLPVERAVGAPFTPHVHPDPGCNFPRTPARTPRNAKDFSRGSVRRRIQMHATFTGT